MGSSSRKTWILFIIVLIGALVWYVVVPFVRQTQEDSMATRIRAEAYSDYKKPILTAIGTTTLTVELVMSESERQRGLSGRGDLGENEGMLFVFETDGFPSFWMKDMQFPIDIAWLDKEFRIVDIKADVSPSTYPASFEPEVPARYALEANAGFFAANGIGIGDVLYLAERDDL